MGRIVTRRPVTRVRLGSDPVRRVDFLAVEEPLEIRVHGTALAVTMRTPGHDVELATGFLVSEGVVAAAADVVSAIHCGGPGTGRDGEPNTYNVLDLTLAAGVALPAPELARNFTTTSACGLCGKASIEAIETISRFELTGDDTAIDAESIARLPERLREVQAAFDKTGGLHAAALVDMVSGEMLTVREDVGRHNAVDKVIGWATLQDRLPLRGTVLLVSGRASFELVQKAVMAGIPVLAAVSAPSSLAVDLANDAGLTLIGFVRDPSMVVYAHPHRLQVGARTRETTHAGSTSSGGRW